MIIQVRAGPMPGAVQPPRWLFHVVSAVLGAILLVCLSYPGMNFAPLLLVVAALLGSAALWVVWVVIFVRERVRAGRHVWSWWFVVAPLGAVLVMALVVGQVPLQARWALSRPDFEAVVAGLPASPTVAPEPEDQESSPADRDLPIGRSGTAAEADQGWPTAKVAARIGSYRVLQARLVPGGVLFTESTGSLGDDAGFAYLPAGPGPELEGGGFEQPRFRELGGPWYAWTAGW